MTKVLKILSAIALTMNVGACCGGSSGSSEKSAGGGTPSVESTDKGEAKPQAAAAENLPKIGEKVSFDDSEWVILSAKDMGSTAKSNNQFQKDGQTEGKFVTVSFKVTNKTNKEERVMGGLKVVDSKGREFGNVDQEMFYIPKDKKTLGLEAMPSSMSREFWSVFEVPADATGLKLQVRGLSILGDKKLVDLGLSASVAGSASAAPVKKK